MRIDGATFAVTGGASGLGRATAERVLAQGGRVAILDLPRSAGAKVAAELGAHALFAPCDVTSAEEVTGALDAAARLGALRGLVNCAGVAIAEKTHGKRGAHDAPSASNGRSRANQKMRWPRSCCRAHRPDDLRGDPTGFSANDADGAARLPR